MSKITLVRVENGDEHTMGCLLVDGRYVCMSLENPWHGNERNISCIPVGLYEVGYVMSPKFGWTLEVKHVPKRDSILFHPGNLAADTSGCILPGQGVSFFGDSRAVTSSRSALTLLLSLLPDEEEHLLEVLMR